MIVGRGSQVLLAQHRDVFHVRIVAPLEQRIAYVMRREGLDRAAAQERIQRKDRDRVRYLQTRYHEHPADAHLYDIVVNTAVLDLESVVDALVFVLEARCGGSRNQPGTRTGYRPSVLPWSTWRFPPHQLRGGSTSSTQAMI